jgi:hypothetical protein
MGRNASLGKHLLLIPCRVHINFILKRHVILNSIYPAALLYIKNDKNQQEKTNVKKTTSQGYYLTSQVKC